MYRSHVLVCGGTGCHSNRSAEIIEKFKKEIAEVFPEIEIVQNPLSLSVACHIGHGAIAVACSRKVVVE